MKTVDVFFLQKNPPNMLKCPKNCHVKIESALKTSDFNFFTLAFRFTLI